MSEGLAERAGQYVRDLCRFPDRHPGRPGNDAANDLFERLAGSFGFEVRSTAFDCLDWEHGEAWLETGEGNRVALEAGPYSHPVSTEATLGAASSVEEIEEGDFRGKVLLLHGPVAAHQLMPKRFPFYSDRDQLRIIEAVERQAPAAVLGATGRDPEMVGSQSPFPLFEDGDFEIPNAFLQEAEGDRLLGRAGERVRVDIDSRRVPARGRQLVARRAGTGDGARRVVVFGHIDSRHGTPGALDNASGVAVMLALAELLAERPAHHAVELVPLNGEDYYAASGHLVWLAANQERFGDIALGLNADDAGHVGQRVAVSLYGCPPVVEVKARGLIAAEPDAFVEGPKWPQGDHSLFVMRGVPAVAFTSEDFMDILANTAHSPYDTPELVDGAALARIARYMDEVIRALA